MKPGLAFVGAGKVGSTLARLCYQNGYTITAIYSRSLDHARNKCAGCSVGRSASGG